MRGSFYCRYRFLGKEACKLLISLKWKRKEIKNLPIKATKEPLQYSVVSSPASCSEIHSLNPSIDQKIGRGGKKGGGRAEREETKRQRIPCWLHLLAGASALEPAQLEHRVTLEYTALNTETLSSAYQVLKTGLTFKLHNRFVVFFFFFALRYLNISVYISINVIAENSRICPISLFYYVLIHILFRNKEMILYAELSTTE